MNKFKTDEEIKDTFSMICEPETNFKIDFKSEKSGWMEIYFPQNEEKNIEIAKRDSYLDSDLLQEDHSDSFIIYEHSGQIAFDNWYSDEAYDILVKAILDKIKDSPEGEAQSMALNYYKHLL